eukprot:3397963-Rhodomonas_salina.1
MAKHLPSTLCDAFISATSGPDRWWVACYGARAAPKWGLEASQDSREDCAGKWMRWRRRGRGDSV